MKPKHDWFWLVKDAWNKSSVSNAHYSAWHKIGYQ